jgi:hypothetical protein
MVTISMIDFARLLRDIPSRDWVALSEDGQAVVACGPDRCAVLQEAEARGERNPIVLWIADDEVHPIMS